MVNLILPIALGVVMLSLGLALTVDDYRRVLRFPRTVIVALICQTLVLPLVCLGLCIAFHLPPELAVGLMLLAASPGGVMASVFSHLADGDLALNITLTAVNSALSLITLPLLLAGSMAFFLSEGKIIAPQFDKIVQVFVIILAPVAIGMWVRSRWPGIAKTLDRPVKIFALVFLLTAGGFAIVKAWDLLVQNFAALGGAVISFNLLSLAVGYGVPRWLDIGARQSTAISMEIGSHNGALAIAIALSPLMLNNPAIAVPPTLYGVLSLFPAAAFAFFLNRFVNRERT